MASYFSVIVGLHLLATLHLITPTVEALKCYETSESCDNEECVDNEPAASSSKTFAVSKSTDGKERRDNLIVGIKTVKNATHVAQLDMEEWEILESAYSIVGFSLDRKACLAEPPYSDQYPLCYRMVLTATVEFPHKTFQKTSVVRGGTYGVPRCEMYEGMDHWKNLTFTLTVNFCMRDGDNSNSEGRKIVASNVLLMAPLILIGIGSFSLCMYFELNAVK